MINIYPQYADNIFKRAIGLIGQNDGNYSIFLKTRFGIHTFFLKRNIDILILNEENKVIEIKENLKPNRIFLWNMRYNKVLELPSGSIQKMKILIGTKIKICQV